MSQTGCLGYVFQENCIGYFDYEILHFLSSSFTFQFLFATLHPVLMVDCVMNLRLDSIAHVSKDIMERFAKLKVD